MLCDSCRKEIPAGHEQQISKSSFWSAMKGETDRDDKILCEKCAFLPWWKKLLTSWWFWVIIVIVFFCVGFLSTRKKKKGGSGEITTPPEPSTPIEIIREDYVKNPHKRIFYCLQACGPKVEFNKKGLREDLSNVSCLECGMKMIEEKEEEEE